MHRNPLSPGRGSRGKCGPTRPLGMATSGREELEGPTLSGLEGGAGVLRERHPSKFPGYFWLQKETTRGGHKVRVLAGWGLKEDHLPRPRWPKAPSGEGGAGDLPPHPDLPGLHSDRLAGLGSPGSELGEGRSGRRPRRRSGAADEGGRLGGERRDGGRGEAQRAAGVPSEEGSLLMGLTGRIGGCCAGEGLRGGRTAGEAWLLSKEGGGSLAGGSIGDPQPCPLPPHSLNN